MIADIIIRALRDAIKLRKVRQTRVVFYPRVRQIRYESLREILPVIVAAKLPDTGGELKFKLGPESLEA